METMQIVYVDSTSVHVILTDAQGFTATHTLTWAQVCKMKSAMDSVGDEE